MSGRKDDTGKLRTDLIPSEPIEALAAILTFGAAKYDDNNWMEGLKFRKVYAAMLRHLLDYRRGEFQDHESGHPHLWHAFCNLMFLIYYNHPNYYKRYEEFNNFKQEWAQKSQETIPKTCSTCFYTGTGNPACFSCDSCEDVDLLNWEPKETIPGIEKMCYNCRFNDFPANIDPCNTCLPAEKRFINWEPENE